MQQQKENPGQIKSKDFEKSLKRLEQIVEQLESGNLALEKSIQLFEEGRKLGTDCMQYLTEVEQRLLKVIDDDPQNPITEPFADQEDDES